MVVTIHMFGAVVYSYCKICDSLKLFQKHVLNTFVLLTVMNVIVTLSPSPVPLSCLYKDLWTIC